MRSQERVHARTGGTQDAEAAGSLARRSAWRLGAALSVFAVVAVACAGGTGGGTEQGPGQGTTSGGHSACSRLWRGLSANGTTAAATQSRAEGGDEVPAEELVRNIAIVAPPPADEALLLVHDLLTWGNHIAAVDHALSGERPCAAFTVATTDAKSCTDCFIPRVRQVLYDPAQPAWGVRVEDMVL
jgi:hypothetical protein